MSRERPRESAKSGGKASETRRGTGRDVVGGQSAEAEKERLIRELVEHLTNPGAERISEAEEAELLNTVRRVGELSAEMHGHDEESARLREETRRLIEEMLRDLHLKAA